jgi:hypothetical protein
MLPIYELKISDAETEVDYVALVDEPAIQRDFVAFNKAQQKYQFNEEKRIISGPLMVPDMLIYRNNELFGEHYVKFSAQTIKDIVVKFFKKKYQSNVNIMHDTALQVEGCTMFESFISDSERGILPMQGFEDMTNGTWFVSFYVDNNEVWSEIKAGTFKGFSVEGLFGYGKAEKTPEQLLTEIIELLK